MNEKVLVAVFTYNNGYNVRKTLARFKEDFPYDIVIHDDGSTDDTLKFIGEFNFKTLRNPTNKGIGYSVKRVIKYAHENGYEILALIAGNNKNCPEEIPRLVNPIIKENYDYVQGSRFYKGGKYDNTPLFRIIMIKIHAFIFRILTGFRGTDALEGFKAYKLSIFDNPRINIWQEWLNRYEYETYLHYKVLKLGYRVKEVPISKIYPKNKKGVKYSHIRPIIDWWSIIKPLFFLTLGIRK